MDEKYSYLGLSFVFCLCLCVTRQRRAIQSALEVLLCVFYHLWTASQSLPTYVKLLLLCVWQADGCV